MGATHAPCRLTCPAVVSIHAPVWGRPGRVKRLTLTTNVSIHAPVWGRPGSSGSSGGNVPVSIHAPVWGRLPGTWVEERFMEVSIHAPVWGRRYRDPSELLLYLFQFTPPYGGDQLQHLRKDGRSRFNSRPRMGATSPRTRLRRNLSRFNSRPRMGATTACTQNSPGKGFQFTPPYGGDHHTQSPA